MSIATRILTVNLGIPSHAVEPFVLIQQLSWLAAYVQRYQLAPAQESLVSPVLCPVYLYAAELGIHRSGLTLQGLPQLSNCAYDALQERLHSVLHTLQAAEMSAIRLTSPLLEKQLSNNVPWTLGQLNISLILPMAAQFIGRDAGCALQREANLIDTKPLRQLVNALQMSLHQTPLLDFPKVNSLWCCAKLPEINTNMDTIAPSRYKDNLLAQAWLQGGLERWWQALPSWGADFSQQLLGVKHINVDINNHTVQPSQLCLMFSDKTLTVPLIQKRFWQPWHKRLTLESILL